MKLLDPAEGLKVVASCIAFQFVFTASILSVLIKYWTQAGESHYPIANSEGVIFKPSG